MKSISLVFIILLICFACESPKPDAGSKTEIAEQSTEAVTEQRVFFLRPMDNDTLTSPVSIQMGVKGMKVEQAGVSRQGFGHHHILLNMKSWTINSIIPMSDSTFHYGKGQTETTLDLEPGSYLLTLQFGDGIHASYGEHMATSINITVE